MSTSTTTPGDRPRRNGSSRHVPALACSVFCCHVSREVKQSNGHGPRATVWAHWHVRWACKPREAADPRIHGGLELACPARQGGAGAGAAFLGQAEKWHMEFQVQERSHDYEVFLRTNRWVLQVGGECEMCIFLFFRLRTLVNMNRSISKYIDVHRFLAGSRLVFDRNICLPCPAATMSSESRWQHINTQKKREC